MGKFISKLVKTPGKALSNKSFLFFRAREAAEKWRWYFQLQNIFYVLLSPAQVTPKLQDTPPEAEYYKVSKSHTRQLGCPSVKFFTNNSITLQANQTNLLWILPRSHSTIHEGMQCSSHWCVLRKESYRNAWDSWLWYRALYFKNSSFLSLTCVGALKIHYDNGLNPGNPQMSWDQLDGGHKM